MAKKTITKPSSTVIRKRSRSDSAARAVKAMANVQAGELQPPSTVKLTPAAMKFWPAIIANRARDRWNTADLVNAAELARLHADIERLRAVLDKQGDFGTDGKPHAAHKLLESAGRRAIALSRVLHVHPEATEGRAREAGNTLQQERAAQAALRVDDDVADLLPGLRAH